jgi:hypothetical protein
MPSVPTDRMLRSGRSDRDDRHRHDFDVGREGIESMNTTPFSPRKHLSLGVLALILAVSLFAIRWALVDSSAPPVGSPPIPPPVGELKIPPPGLSRSQFYQRDLVPLLDRAKKQDHASVDSALDRLHQEFERFRAGVPGFAVDVASWGTRWGMVRRLTSDKWKNFWKGKTDPASEEVKQDMLEKFQAHIMSPDALQKAIEATLAQFQDDVTASRNLLLREMQMALTTTAVRLDFPQPEFTAFQRDFEGYVATSVQSQAIGSLENAAVAFIASTAATVATEQLVAQILRLVASEALLAGVEAAAIGGSSMASGGGLGFAAGSFGGPGGTVIGVGVGLAIGAVVDWWLTEQFQANLKQELSTYLVNLERHMIDGVAASGDRPARVGLRETLHKAAEKVHVIESQAVLKALMEAK